eukprot:7405870-Pyramimonas_sp.AAC.1
MVRKTGSRPGLMVIPPRLKRPTLSASTASSVATTGELPIMRKVSTRFSCGAASILRLYVRLFKQTNNIKTLTSFYGYILSPLLRLVPDT